MPGILGSRQDFWGGGTFGGGQPHPRWYWGTEGWNPYYAVFTDPSYFAGDPFYKINTGVNYSSCPEMDCIPPEKVVASVQGFNSKTRISPGFVTNFNGWTFDAYRGQDCYPYGGCDPFDDYFNSCYGRPNGTVVTEVAGRWSDADAYVACVVLYDSGAEEGEYYPWAFIDMTPELYCGWSGLWFEWVTSASHPVLWPNIAFHNGVPLSCDVSYFGNSPNQSISVSNWIDLSDSDSPVEGYFQSNSSINIKYSYPNFFNVDHIYDGSIRTIRNFTWSEVNSNTTLDDILIKPTNTWSYYGNGQYTTHTTFFDDDHNGTYICHRDNGPGAPALGLRPELVPFIEKTATSIPSCSGNDVLIDEKCCPEGSTGIFPPEDNRAGRCCVDCSSESTEEGVGGYNPSDQEVISTSDNAELIFEVGGREVWTFPEQCCAAETQEWISSFDFSTGEDIPLEAPQPDGLFYGVDYACGPRRVRYEYNNPNSFPGGYECNNCYQWWCDTKLGTAKPHLAIFPEDPENTNNTAELTLNLTPNTWMLIHGSNNDYSIINYLNSSNQQYILENLKDEDAFPYSWEVNGVNIINPGSGYEVGTFFYVDFDPNWYLPFVNGQVIETFGDLECGSPGCFEPQPITWSDEYGYTKPEGNIIVYQRLRVSEVDENGGIISLEIVPWYKTPEWIPDRPYLDDETGEQIWHFFERIQRDREKKTKYYVTYLRLLCHPTSVRHPGKDYSVGDIITWEFPEEKNTAKAAIYDTWKNKKAIAVVVDVDEKGGILDWYISGSDRWKQYGGLNLADGALCYSDPGMAFLNPVSDSLETDLRGRYRFLGYGLCNLTYSGKGNPVRSCATKLGINTSTTTQLNLSIVRTNCQTTATIIVYGWPFSDSEIRRLRSGDFDDLGELIVGSIGYYQTYFPPYPLCQGGGVEIEIVYGAENANDSVFGSTIKSAIIQAQGAGYAFKDKQHVEPILPNVLPNPKEEITTQIGEPAEIDYVFDTVSGFPHPDLLDNENYNLGLEIDFNRFSYFPVSDVTIVNPGSGYSVGLTFDIYPENGQAFIDPWSFNGGDNPDTNPNGAWYTGRFSVVDADGYMRYDRNASNNTIPDDIYQFISRNPYLTLEITDVDDQGGIKALDIVNSGMMYRTTWTDGIKHPDIVPDLSSSLGYGAMPEMTINTVIDSKDFGSVDTFTFRGATKDELPDPYWSPDILTIPGNATMGYGRDYANPEHGYYWMLENISLGINTDVRLLAHYDWGINHNGAYGYTPIHYLGESSKYQTYKKVAGSVPSFVPKTTVCSFDPCYHDLLNKSYALYRSYYSLSPYSVFNCDATAQSFVGDATWPSGPPANPHGVLLRKNRMLMDGTLVPLQTRIYNEGDCIGDIILDSETGAIIGPGTVSPNAGGTSIGSPAISPTTSVEQDYYVIEYGMTLTLSSDKASTEFRHVNGRTTIANSPLNS